ncbi:MAG: sugar phosphate isomerase/epimerase [Anaerolineae bacterium]
MESSVTGAWREMKPGLQLYSVRDEADKDLPGVLEAIAQMGYRGVEFAGFLGYDPRDLRRYLDSLGLAAIGTHTHFIEIEQSARQVIQDHHTLGATYCTVPYFKADTVDAWREFADRLNQWGDRFKEAGLRLGYHNHHFEFEPLEDTTPFDILRQVCHPDLVHLELDVAWAQKGGHNPATLIASLGAQSPLIHIKDLSGTGGDVNLGEGVVDMAAVLKAADQAGVVWGIVERDSAPPPTLESAKINLEVLRGLLPDSR